MLASFPKPKFDETVELCVRLGIDPKKSDQMVRGSVSLPKGIGKTRTVAVFAEGEHAEAAEEAGADIVGADDLAKRIQDGFMDFDVCIAHPSMMRYVGKLGKILGPAGQDAQPQVGHGHRGRRPRPFASSRPVRSSSAPTPAATSTCPSASAASPPRTSKRTSTHFVDHLRALKPAAVKGTYVRKVSVSATMSPGITLDVS